MAWIGAIGWPVALFLLWRRTKLTGRLVGLTAVLGTLVWALGVWAFLAEPRTLVVRHVVVESPAWRGPPVRIGLISDTHVGAPHMSAERLERIVARMNAERPDIVLLLGDYAGRHEPAAMRSAKDRSVVLGGIAPFAKLSPPLGVVAVLGNHDAWYDAAPIVEALSRTGAVVLENAAVRKARGDGAFWIAGLADMESRTAQPSYEKALAGVAADEPVIAIAHWPDVFEDAPPGVAITFAGHSHCGQVNLPFLGRLVHASSGSKRWPCGLYEEGGRSLYVTGGVGVSILPVRFNQPPEIVLVTLSGPAVGATSQQ